MKELEVLGRFLNTRTSTAKLTPELKKSLALAAKASPENANTIIEMISDVIDNDVIMLSSERLRAVYGAVAKLKEPKADEISAVISGLRNGAARHGLSNQEWVVKAISFLERMTNREKQEHHE